MNTGDELIDFGSVCSGIEAASVSFEPLGWKAAWFSEIDLFASEVLKNRWPQTPNHGDMTTLVERIRSGEVSAPKVLCGGTPCQAFSVAGGRLSLADLRGNLSLTFCEIANAIDDVRLSGMGGGNECAILWENVPGCLNTHDNAFGCFLGKLAGDDEALEPGPRPEQNVSSLFWAWKKETGQHVPTWPVSGCVVGPRRTVAWRTLDAQHFGLAQRRKRVFVVASALEGFDPAEILLEFEGVRRDSPPSREPGEGFTYDIAPCLTSSGRGTKSAGDTRGNDPVVAVNVNESQRAFRMVAFGEYADDDLASTIKARDYKDATDLAVCITGNITHTLTAEGHDASEDGTGRGTPIVPVFSFRAAGQDGFTPSDICPPLLATDGGGSGVPTVAYAFAENYRGELRLENGDGQISGALSSGGGKAGQGYPAIAYTISTSDANGTRPDRPNGGLYVTESPDVSPALTLAESAVKVVERWPDMAVRRLMPIECARLQGFPDNHCEIPWKGKPADKCPDSLQYKAFGNSWAVNVTKWIGKRLDAQFKKVGGMTL